MKLGLCWGLCLLAGAQAAAELPGAPGSGPLSGHAVLQAAFENYYGCDTRAELELQIRGRQGSERRRFLDIATKEIDGLRRGLARLTAPPHLRGMSFLMIENLGRGDDTFVYLPSQKRMRRITTAQKDDAFVGSDLTYEDMERRRADDYESELRPREQVGGEEAYVVLARPLIHDAYERLEVLVAVADWALLGLRFFKGGEDSPYRVMRMPRSGMRKLEGHVLPTRIDVENVRRGTNTRVTFHGLEVDPELDDRHFAPSWLERGRGFRPAEAE